MSVIKEKKIDEKINAKKKTVTYLIVLYLDFHHSNRRIFSSSRFIHHDRPVP